MMTDGRKINGNSLTICEYQTKHFVFLLFFNRPFNRTKKKKKPSRQNIKTIAYKVGGGGD